VGRFDETALAHWKASQTSILLDCGRFIRMLAWVFVFAAAYGSTSAWGQFTVVTQHNDIGRTGQNNNEVTLNPSNVNSSQFGLLFSQPVDGQIYAQPLYMQALQIPGAGTHNVVFVATENDSVYAFDADTDGGPDQGPLWHASLLSPAYGAAAGATPVSSTEIADDIVPQYGITGTPVIDPVAGVLYVVGFTQEGSSYVLRLHALSLTTGAEMPHSPVTIQAQVAGTGNGSSGGVLNLDPRWENQRNGLLLLNGILYIPFASHADNGDWHGWLLSYNPTTLTQIAAYSASPNGVGSGFWMSGDGLAADVIDPVGHPFGRLFLATGNGDYKSSTPYSNAMDYGDSILNLDLSNGVPTVQDEFTPFNQATLDTSDGDLGSGGLTVLPTQTGTYPNLLVQEGKGGTLYLIDRDAMGGYGATDNVVQEINSSASGNGVWGGPVYWNGYVYTDESHNPVKSYALNNGVLTLSSVSPEKYSFPGPGLSISSAGTTNGLLWAIESDSYDVGGNAVLRAYNASNLATEYYNSNQIPGRDGAGPAVKFAVPTVVNAKVYVGTGNQLDVYGLLNELPSIAPPVITPGTSTFTQPIQVTISDATPDATIFYTTDGSAPSTASAVYIGPITVNTTQTITAIATAPGYDWITPVSATFTSLDNTPTPSMSPYGGTFTTLPTVTLTDSNSKAVIYYTMDGTTPTNASPEYTGPITLTGSKTIKAIAFAPGLNGSGVDSQTYTTQSGVDFSLGFAQAPSIMTFNGSTGLDDSRLQLTNGYTSDTGSAFVTYKLNIQAFTTQFQFQLSNPQADGITFTIQGSKPGAIGPFSGALGFATIPNSVAIKFDFYNDQGEGADSTGLYINGAEPTIPALNLSTSGINLGSGDLMGVNLNYDGVNLEMTITDEVTAATWSCVWQVNIPQIVGGTTAYVGFTGSTQTLTASQKIATWTYTALAPGQPVATATPVIFPGTSNYGPAQTATLSSKTANAAIYYTIDGTVPTTTSPLYTAPFPVKSTEMINAMAVGPTGVVSGMSSATMEIASGVTNAVPAYSPTNHGFSYGQIILNGATLVSGTLEPAGQTINTQSLELTDGSLGEAHSAFFANPVNIQAFTSDFDFQLPTASAEGFAFVIQNAGLNAVGTSFGCGFGSGGAGNAIANSVALAFDINGTAGLGANTALLYVNGSIPANTTATNLGNNGIMLSSGHSIHVHAAYDGNNLSALITDNTNGANVTLVYPLGIPAVVGGNTAYVGFTGATSATAGATQNIQDWTYAIATPAQPFTAIPVISPAGGTFTGPTTVTISDATPNAVIYYTTNGVTPTTASPVYTGPIAVNATGTIEAVALAPNDALSIPASDGFTIQAPSIAYPAGFGGEGIALNGATITGTTLQLTDGGSNEARSAYFTAPMNIQSFTTTFDFQELNAVSDGFTFVIQNQGLTAVGSPGGGLGYGPEPNGPQGYISKSVAVKFDIHNNSGEGNDSTGVYVDGAVPTLPATNLSGTGIILASGHVIRAQITYNGTTLTLTLTDNTTGATVTDTYTVNIPSAVGGSTAYVGFTGGTGGSSATQNILDWNYAVAAPAINYPTGFTSGALKLNGATIAGTALQITDGGVNEARSAYFTTPLNIQAFTTAFDFQELNAVSDGFTFVIQSQGLTAVGSPGGGLGYGPEPNGPQTYIGKSVAVKFDIHNNSGEGSDSTGIYLNGAVPTVPATNLSNTGITLASGHQIHAQITYNGSALVLTLTDEVTTATVTETYQVNLPAVVGGNTAYIGFTGGTGGSSATQNILDWTYSVTTPAVVATATPVIGPAAGTFPTPTAVTISDATPNAVIYYTTNGTVPTTSSPVYTGPITMNASGTIQAIAQAPNYGVSGVVTSAYTIQAPAAYYPTGFTTQGLTLNGAVVNGSALQITDGGTYEAHSAYFSAPLNIQAFTTSFDFQLLNAVSDGFTFVIQNQGLNAVGSPGGGLGYGPEANGPQTVIGNSIAVKFDIHNNSGEGNDSTGVYLDGAVPTLPATNLSTTGIVLSSGDAINAQIVYNGTTLTLTLTDKTTNTTVTETYNVNIPAAVGGNSAFIGFTGGTGGSSAVQNILDWSFTPGTTTPEAAAAVSYSTGFSNLGLTLNGGAKVNGNVLQLTDGGAVESRSAFFSLPIGVQQFMTSFDFQELEATADGFTFVIQNQGTKAVGSPGGGLGYGPEVNGPQTSIGKSVAVKFDIHNDAGEGTDSTGVYVDGAAPTVPSTNLTSAGIVLSSGDVIHAQLAYNGSFLTVTLTDKTTKATVTESYPVNIPQAVGGKTAYVGFTGSTGGLSAKQNVLDWNYVPSATTN
jgi:hypothetical protein